MGEVATYALYVDWANDGSFATSGDDITDDLIEFTIERGFSSPLARVATVGRANLVLNNVSQAYSPPLDADVVPRRPMKLDMTYSGSTETLFRGYLESIGPDFGQYGSRRVALECVDGMALVDHAEGEIALSTGVYADDIIDDVVAAVYSPPATGYQDGLNYFVTSAEGWGYQGDEVEQVRASKKIEDACMSDWGRFFIARDGTATFFNRHQMPLDTSTELTLNDTMLGMNYRRAVATVRNYVEVTCYPRTVGTVNEVLGRLSQQSAPRIEASDAATFVLRFRDPVNSKVKVGGKDVITPVEGTDFICTSDPEGTGDDESSNVTPSMTAYGDHAVVTLTNGVAHPVFVQRLWVRGLPVRVREPVTMVAQDATSITAYQKRRLAVRAALLSDPADAQLLANYLLAYYKDPLHDVTGVEILANKDATWMAAVRDLELMDRVVLSETQVGLSSWAGYIYRMRHHYRSRYDHRLALDIEQAYTISGTPFRIGVSQLNSGHVLIY